jgi:hypothetical protein
MKLARVLIIFLLFGFVAKQDSFPDKKIYELEGKMMEGDKKALFEIVKYFDNNKKVIEYLGYHRMETTESEIARRIVDENCLFMTNEIKIWDSTSTAQKFSDFLNLKKDSIVFSPLANAFLITPLEKRNVNFEIRAISPAKKEELKNREKELLSPEWVTENNIELLIDVKNPTCLLKIASELFKERERFNQYYFHKEEFTDLLEFLTGTEIGVEDENKKITWHVDKDFYPEPQLNLLIYFAKYYSQYSWDEKDSIFKNPNVKIEPFEKESSLFEMLGSKNDSIAIDAFTQLTTCDPAKVIQLADEYEKSDMDHNYVLPTFPFRFLKQMVVLTDYCRTNNINYTGSAEFRKKIAPLQTKMPFPERYKLENNLIDSLSFDDITALEYWSLIHEQSYQMTYSAGRILDIFYSKNWNKMLQNKKQLDCYLKKSKQYDQLGIIGICNNYLKKFSNSSPATMEMLNNYQSSDSDIQVQVKKIIVLNTTTPPARKIYPKENAGNKDYEIKDLEKQLIHLTTFDQDSVINEPGLVELLSKINYDQIGMAMKYIENVPFKNAWGKYSFLESDWGFFMLRGCNNEESRKEFLEVYSTHSEYQLYAYYLDKAGIDYKNADSTLNYDKIYELMKYDDVVAFVGGGGGTADREVYSLIKLLELTFNTTLGFPHKLCNSNGMYGCDSDDRIIEWTKYFEDNKLLKEKHDEPISFHAE